MIPLFDLSTPAGRDGLDARLTRLRATSHARSDAADTVAQIVEAVRTEGDAAVVRYMRQWTDPHFEAGRIRVTADELASADAALEPDLRRCLDQAIAHVRQYQQHIMPSDPPPVTIDGAELGLRFSPFESVGLAVPGGTAPLFSTLIMLAVPAQVAGVEPAGLSVIHPPPTRTGDQPQGDISPLVLATCRILGIETVYRIGGAQAVAALAFGTEHVGKVDMIAGPGNVYVQLAKQQVAGIVGTEEGFYGPSEIVTLADDTADPRRIAADLIAQAEHDPGKCFLVTWSRTLIDRISAEIATQAQQLERLDAITAALHEESAAVLVADEDEVVEIGDAIAAEHVNLAVADPQALLARLRHGGEFFLGDQTPVAAGDYYAGPSHCLPTGTTARFASGVSVYTFLKRSGTVCYPQGMSAATAEAIARLAEAEGLTAHAASARIRL